MCHVVPALVFHDVMSMKDLLKGYSSLYSPFSIEVEESVFVVGKAKMLNVNLSFILYFLPLSLDCSEI
jgi:hypothetical protein